MKEISILIPTYNHVCFSLVSVLQKQAALLAINYEIIVADDGSTDAATISGNRAINSLPFSRYVERLENTGRAAIRNFLAKEAQHEWLLFIDSDMVVADNDFLRHYAECSGYDVVDGGVTIGGDPHLLQDNLRYRYEKAAEQQHTMEQRRQHPYRDFHTANFLVRRSIMLRHPFDLRFRHYGYEDVLFGKTLEKHNIPILHIDNPLSFEVFEGNTHFLDKTEEGLRTLHEFRNELHGYSRLLDLSESLSYLPLHLLWRMTGTILRSYLIQHPNQKLFTLYRLLYFCSIK